MSGLFKFGFSSDKKSDEEHSQKRKGKAASKQQYEQTKRKRVFCQKWKEEFPWIEHDDKKNLMYCVACRKYETDGRFTEGTDNFRIDGIKVHRDVTSHINNWRKYQIKQCSSVTSSIKTCYTGELEAIITDESMPESSGVQEYACQPVVQGPMDDVIRRLNADQMEQLKCSFNTAYFVAKEELPFTMYPSLLQLQKKNGVILPESYNSDQACRRFMKHIYGDIHSEIRNLVKDARVFSLLFDGATDVSVSENEIVYARVVDQGVPKNVFIKISAVQHAHAEGVLAAIESAIDSIDPGWDWKQKLVATGSDGASVNLGKRHSVAKLLKDTTPHLIAMHCVSHRLELGAMDAMKDRDCKMFADLKSVMTNLHKHYHYSAKAIRELQMIADAMEDKMVRPVNLSGTRWMPHMSRCLEVLLNKYSTFVTHFENTLESRTGTVEVQSRARLILKHLKDYKLLCYMHFLKDILDILSQLSLQFQKDGCGLPEATEALETACLRLTALHQRPGPNMEYFNQEVTDDHKFKTVQLQAPALTMEQLKAKQDSMIDSVIEHISRRVGDIDSNELLKSMQIFFPVNLPDTDAEIAVYGEDDLNLLCQTYNDLLLRMGCDIQHLKAVEWPALKIHMKRQHGHATCVTAFYNRLFSNVNLQENFVNILMLVEIVLAVPVSSAICERGFSTMTRIKSDWRSRLDIEMLNTLMAISITGPPSEDYNAQRALELWWNGGQRARRPLFPDQA